MKDETYDRLIGIGTATVLAVLALSALAVLGSAAGWVVAHLVMDTYDTLEMCGVTP